MDTASAGFAASRVDVASALRDMLRGEDGRPRTHARSAWGTVDRAHARHSHP